MGREGSKIHKWTHKDERNLLLAVEECQPLMPVYKRQGRGIENWWDTVAGRLLPDIQVTGGACRRRWLLMSERDTEAALPGPKDAWDHVKEMVEQYEADIQEVIFYDLRKLSAKVSRIDQRVSVLFRELTGIEDSDE